MKTNAIIRIVLFTLGILILGTVLLAGLGIWNYGFLRDSVEVSHSAQISEIEAASADPAVIQNIKIQWAAGNITIQPSAQVNEIQIAESEVPEKDRMICKVSGSTLTVQFCRTSKNSISLGTTIDSKRLVIQVPAGWVCQTLEIEAASADVEINNMTIGKLDFDSASGLCNMKNCSVTDMDVDVASGDLDFSGRLDTLDFDGASADCTLVLTHCPSSIDLDGMSGELDITLPSDCGFTVTTEGLSSSFGTDFQTVSRNGSHIHGDGHCKIEVDAMSGSTFIHNSGDNCHEGQQSHHTNHH